MTKPYVDNNSKNHPMGSPEIDGQLSLWELPSVTDDATEATYLCVACWRRIPVGVPIHACFYED